MQLLNGKVMLQLMVCSLTACIRNSLCLIKSSSIIIMEAMFVVIDLAESKIRKSI